MTRDWGGLRVLVALCVLLLGPSVAAGSAPGESVLIVVNSRHPDGARVAERYRAIRAIPADHVVTVDVATDDQISWATYVTQVEGPVRGWFGRRAAHDRITYLVLGPGFPTRIAGTTGRMGTLSSLDSELTLIYRRMTGERRGPTPRVANPYFSESPREGHWPVFDRSVLDIYLVARLDGFTGDDALSLAARCEASAPGGRFVLDDRAPLDAREHRWFTEAAARLATLMPPSAIVLDQTLTTVRDEADVMGFYSWGSADPGHRRRQIGLEFRPGAIAASLSSADARTFVEPPAEWVPGSWQDRTRYYRGSPEWLAGDLIRGGLTGLAANVADPYVDGAVRPQILFPAYVSGRTLGEAMYLATPYLSWRGMVIGDPLCRPYTRAEPPDEAPPPLITHAPSGLTQPFFDRLVTEQVRAGDRAPRGAVELRLAAEAWAARGDHARSLGLLDELAEAFPAYVPGLLARAMNLESAGDRRRAIQAYEQLLAAAPKNVVALNNLAYALTAEPADLDRAQVLARQAYELSRGDPTVADTYGWVLHLRGEHAQAVRVLREVVSRQPNLAEGHVHLALALLAQGVEGEARQHWEKALSLNAALASTDEVGPLARAFGTGRGPDR